ncbi:metal-dependent hydrolase [Parasphingorhabdus sp.]|uniref:metal-dependent hydrolase n=1 Tax=Parasphingorhabdus sp. TaxID=2709688 RepID=UPI0030026BD5
MSVGSDQMPEIVVRAIPFAFSENINPVWHPERHEWSHMVNGASLSMPYLEPFLIKTVREALKQASDASLKDGVCGFIAQEGHHFKNHRRYNDILKRGAYPDLADVEQEMDTDFKRLQSKSLRWRTAYTAGFETMTMGITEWLIKDRRDLFKHADPSVSSLILWHMVEETEHKNVAFDLYQDLYGSYLPRAFGLAYASWHVMKFTRRAYIRMLSKDGLWFDMRSRLRLYKMIGRAFANIGPAMMKSLLPGYHPSKVKDPDWVIRWAHAYAGLKENEIPLLDTSDPDIPAHFATS